MESVVMFVSIPIIVFLVLVAPLWLMLHYRSKKQISQGLTEQESVELARLAHSAEKMSERILTLEKILDSESPNWRSHHE